MLPTLQASRRGGKRVVAGRSSTYLPNQTLPNIEAWRDAGGAKQGHYLPNQTFPKYMLQRRRQDVAGSGWCRVVPGWAGRYEDPPIQPTRPGTGRRARTAQPGTEHAQTTCLWTSPSCFCEIFSSVVDPGCLSRIPDPDFYPSWIQDPGSRILDPKTATKARGEKKLVVIPFYVATNFTKLYIVLVLNCWRKKIGPIFKEL